MTKFVFKEEEKSKIDTDNDDSFLFKEEDVSDDCKRKENSVWRVLIVDDDMAVHQVTKLVLTDIEIEHRKLELISVYSKQEAKELLSHDKSFCMAFVDVVMETDHAGLELVHWIRNDLKNQAIRLVLRTGQAGTAPESKVIKEFDINDYKEKTDFTSGKMITTVYAAIRAYRDIMTIQRSLDAFKKLISATNELLQVHQLRTFGSAALSHLLALMDVESSALYIARSQTDIDCETTNLIIACTGKYISESDNLESSAIDEKIKGLITQVFDKKEHYTDDYCFVGYYETASNSASVLYIEFENDREHFRANLAELFATNVALILESLSKQHEIERTQKELMYIVGDAIELRSRETGAHVKRVAIICEKLASYINLPSLFIETLKIAAPLHDIGKIAIPDEILNKPAKLDEQEWQVMKTHAEIGGELLAKSKVSASKLAARIARYHHENWDGSGYPEGLKAKDIPMEARIMALADVYDALGSDRCYKNKWPEEDIINYIKSQRSIKFDPELVDILLEHYQEFADIRKEYPDE